MKIALNTRHSLIVFKLFVALSVCSLLSSCTKDEMEEGKGNIDLMLTNASPVGDLQQVNVQVLSVQVHYADETKGAGGWVPLETNQGVYDLTVFSSGNSVAMGSGKSFDPADITAVKMVLGQDSNSVTLRNGSTHVLRPVSVEVPVDVITSVRAGKTILITLDFDAVSSVQASEVGDYTLVPRVKVRSVISRTQGGA